MSDDHDEDTYLKPEVNIKQETDNVEILNHHGSLLHLALGAKNEEASNLLPTMEEWQEFACTANCFLTAFPPPNK